MTLPAAGPFDGSEIRAELRQSGGNIVIPDATTRWLTDLPSGNIQYPNSFFSKRAVKFLGRTSVGGGSSFSNNIGIGPDFPSKTTMFVVGAIGPASANLSITNFTANGSTVEFIDQRNAFNGTRSMMTAIGLFPSGGITSPLINVSLAASCTALTYAVYSISNRGTPGVKNINGTASGSATSLSVNAGVPVANGFFVVSAMKANNAGGSITIGGATASFDIDQGDTIRWAVGVSNRLAFEASRNGNFGAGGPADLCLISVAGFG